jgi:hypothetical protein
LAGDPERAVPRGLQSEMFLKSVDFPRLGR